MMNPFKHVLSAALVVAGLMPAVAAERIKIVSAPDDPVAQRLPPTVHEVAVFVRRREEVFRGTLPHFIAHLIAIAILLAVPSLALWLPSRIGN